MPLLPVRLVRRVLVLLAAAVLTAGAGRPAAQAPALGEVAKKEQERRKTQKPTGKVYTNKDLPESAQGKPLPQPPAGGGAQAPAAPGTTVADDGPAAAGDAGPGAGGQEKDEAWWRNRIVAAREDLRRNEVFAEALQTRINALSTDFVNRDDPFQRAKVGEDRDKAVAELARVKSEIERGRKQIEDIEEEARKAGVPPGWLR